MATTGRSRRHIPVVRRPARHRVRTGAGEPADFPVKVVEHGGLAWYDIRGVNQQALDFLRDEFGFHMLALEDVTSRVQRPKLDVYDDYLFVVMHFPVHNKVTRVTLPSE